MAFEIVDGMTGTKHISSDDLSALNIATIGESNCVLNYGDNFNLTMASANSATLGTGVGMVGGKRFWNQAATSLTIQSGTQGQKRNDLIVARYAKTSAGIESITPVVIKGTSTTGTAADPEVTANDLKLWRVPLDGINAGTPVKLFDPVTPLATIGDSVSQDSGWKYLKNEYLWKIAYRKLRGVVYLQLENAGNWTIGARERRDLNEILPDGYRPSFDTFMSVAGMGNDFIDSSCYVKPNGVISLYFLAQCSYFRVWCSYPV